VQAGPLSSLPPTQVNVLQSAPEKTRIRLSHAVPHNEAVICCPLPTIEYQTAGCVFAVVQVMSSLAPVEVAAIVVPAMVCPHVIGVELQTKSLGGATGAATQLTTNEKVEGATLPDTKM
jgi:hypothetical protein